MNPHHESNLSGARLPLELQNGSASEFSLGIQSIILARGEKVDLPVSGVTAIVGANNVGKSTFLRQLSMLVSRDPEIEPHDWRLIESIELDCKGSPADLTSWLNVNFRFVSRGNQIGFIAPHGSQLLSFDDLGKSWPLIDRLSRLSPFMIGHNSAFDRLNAVAPRQRRGLSDGEYADHPFFRLEDDFVAMAEISAISERYFRVPLTLDWLGTNIELRMGRVALEPPRVDRVTSEYRQAVARLPLVNEQGDGMKSFLGLILELVAGTHPVLLVDEPEAFLHPPQASALGYELGRLSEKNGVQLILATHDRNILTGLLEAGVEVSIIRLDRTGDVTEAHQIEASELRSVWADSVLRYSNVLDGLFHRLAVIAEADRDCRFYAAALSEADKEETLPIPPSDVLFIPSGGKGGMIRLASALRAAHVPVVVTPDLDLLNEKNKVRSLVYCMHSTEAWEPLEKLYSVATNAFRQPRPQATCANVLAGINAVLGSKLSEPYTPELKKEVAAQLRTYNSPWQDLKDYGELAFSRYGGGQAGEAGASLLGALDALGIVVVRVGELEGFAPNLNVTKGVEWLPAALKNDAHRSRAALSHVRRFLAIIT